MTCLERLQFKDSAPVDEVCRCPAQTTMHLRYEFTELPLFCVECTGQILPSTLHLTEDLAQEILEWRTVYAALYELWLDSSDYEAFARSALFDPAGNINRRGLAIARRLSEQRATYYWWFSDDADSSPLQCPVCHTPMEEHATRRFRFCHSCHISG
jgi:hypothetical protein